jgi:receptor protein-tyrosine kinase
VGRPGDKLHDVVGASAIEETSLVSLTVKQGSREGAGRLAGAVARATIQAIDEDVRRQLDAQQQEIQARIASVTAQIDRSAEEDVVDRERLRSLQLARNALTEQLGSVLGQGVAGAPRMSLGGPPNVPASAASPRPLLNVLAGVLLGLLVGVGLAWLRARTDTTLQSSKEATELLDLPVVGSIPKRRSASLDHELVRNAFDVLHANLAPPGPDAELERIVVVTSPDERAGTASVAQGLAAAAARAGRDVVLVDGDLRRRGLSERLGQAEAQGVSDAVLSGDPALVPVSLDGPYRFVPAGTAVPNTTRVLHSQEVRRLLTDLGDGDRLVIVDTPPAGSLPDASILAALADDVLVVARAGTTERDDLTSLVSSLRRRPYGQIAGLVVVEPRADAASLAQPPQGELDRGRLRVRP